MFRFFAAGGLCFLACFEFEVAAVPALPVINTNNVVVVTNAPFSARGDGVSTNTAAIQNAINSAATTNGGCTVEIPGPGTYLCGPLTLKSRINLQVDGGATLQMLPYASWPGTTTFINGSSLQDVEISGSGTIDGQGANWWAAYNSSGISRPYFINFGSCTRVLVQGVTLQNPPTFHLFLKGNNVDVTVQGVTINTPASPNTDGMDLASSNILVKDCYISDGDDNIEIGGSQLLADLLVTNCTFGIGHGVSIGSITSGDVSNVTVVNCTFSGTDYGIRMKSDNDRGGLIQNLNYFNIGMTNVKYGAAVIYSYYNTVGTPTAITPQKAAATNAAAITGTTPYWRNIVISNLNATISSSGIAGIIWGRTEAPATNLVFQRVNITAPKAFDIYNARDVRFVDCRITPTSSGQKTFEIWHEDVTVSNSVSVANAVSFDGLGGDTNAALALYNVPVSLTSTDLFGADPITLGGSILTNIGNLTLTASDAANFALGTNLSRLTVSGGVTLSNTLNITAAGGFTATNYLLFTYIGGLTNAPVLGALPTVHSYSYHLDTNTPGQIKLVVTAPASPVIGRIMELPASSGGGNGSFILSGSGGVTNGTYYVLTSTNVALPLNEWTITATNPFDASGNFIFTNTPAPGAPQLFYLLQLP